MPVPSVGSIGCVAARLDRVYHVGGSVHSASRRPTGSVVVDHPRGLATTLPAATREVRVLHYRQDGAAGSSMVLLNMGGTQRWVFRPGGEIDAPWLMCHPPVQHYGPAPPNAAQEDQ